MTTLATEVVGYCAAILTTVAFVPQVLQALRTKDLSSVSLAMYITFCIGIALWLVYGLMLKAWPVVIANLFTLGLAGLVLALKVQQVKAKKHLKNNSVL
jgi:MtN3 and saliva related transmembrane protein